MKPVFLMLVAALLVGCAGPDASPGATGPTPGPDGTASTTPAFSLANVTASDCTEYVWRYASVGDAPARPPPEWQEPVHPDWGTELAFYDCARFASGSVEIGPVSFVLELIPVEDTPPDCWQGADLGRYFHRAWANDTRLRDAFVHVGLPAGLADVERTADGGRPINATTWVVEIDGVASTFEYGEGTSWPRDRPSTTLNYVWTDGARVLRFTWSSLDGTYQYDAPVVAGGDPQPPLLASHGPAPKVAEVFMATNVGVHGVATWFDNLECQP